MLASLPSPSSLAELSSRARSLAGRSIAELARELGVALDAPSTQRKGKSGSLIERALGGVNHAVHGPDFAALGVELKTLPVTLDARPLESTFVCSFSLHHAERAAWETSALRAKLAHVLFVPLVRTPEGARIGAPFFWRPSQQEEAILRGDFEELAGHVALGHVETLDARRGAWLQLRPKAAHGRVRIVVRDADGEPVATIPRGFYLRARVTGWLLRRALANDCPPSRNVTLVR